MPDTLKDLLTRYLGTGWAPGVQQTGVRPDYGLSTATGISPAARSVYERTLAPGEKRSAESLRDMLAEVILSGVPVGGVSGRPPQREFAAGGRRPQQRFYRNTQDSNPDPSNLGYMMFGDKPEKVEHFGKKGWSFKTSSVKPSEIVHANDPDLKLAVLKALRAAPGDVRSYGPAAPLVRGLNPKQIVDSAGIWDDPRAVEVIWRDVLEPRGIKAVTTEDGAIVFDATLVKGRR